jgi:hypothetical protein
MQTTEEFKAQESSSNKHFTINENKILQKPPRPQRRNIKSN